MTCKNLFVSWSTDTYLKNSGITYQNKCLRMGQLVFVFRELYSPLHCISGTASLHPIHRSRYIC